MANEKELTIPEAITRAQDLRASPEMMISEKSARKIIDGLLSALEASPCYLKAMQRGEEVFVFREPDRAAVRPISLWADIAEAHDCRAEKVESARVKAKRWSELPLYRTKWPD